MLRQGLPLGVRSDDRQNWVPAREISGHVVFCPGVGERHRGSDPVARLACGQAHRHRILQQLDVGWTTLHVRRDPLWGMCQPGLL